MKYVSEEDVCQMIDGGDERATVIVASEPITKDKAWREVPGNHLVTSGARHHVEMQELP